MFRVGVCLCQNKTVDEITQFLGIDLSRRHSSMSPTAFFILMAADIQTWSIEAVFKISVVLESAAISPIQQKSEG